MNKKAGQTWGPHQNAEAGGLKVGYGVLWDVRKPPVKGAVVSAVSFSSGSMHSEAVPIVLLVFLYSGCLSNVGSQS